MNEKIGRVINSDFAAGVCLFTIGMVGETLQSDKIMYGGLKDLIGVGAAAFVKGHLSDAITVPVGGALGGWLGGIAEGRSDSDTLRFFRMIGVASSALIAVSRELKTMGIDFNLAACKDSGLSCRGEWTDMAFFVLPAIAILAWGTKRLISDRNASKSGE